MSNRHDERDRRSRIDRGRSSGSCAEFSGHQAADQKFRRVTSRRQRDREAEALPDSKLAHADCSRVDEPNRERIVRAVDSDAELDILAGLGEKVSKSYDRLHFRLQSAWASL